MSALFFLSDPTSDSTVVALNCIPKAKIGGLEGNGVTEFAHGRVPAAARENRKARPSWERRRKVNGTPEATGTVKEARIDSPAPNATLTPSATAANWRTESPATQPTASSASTIYPPTWLENLASSDQAVSPDSPDSGRGETISSSARSSNRARSVQWRTDLTEYPIRILKDARGCIVHQTPRCAFIALYDDETDEKTHAAFIYQHVISIETSPGRYIDTETLCDNPESNNVAYYFELEDREVVFDAEQLPGPTRTIDHHKVKFAAHNVRVKYGLYSYKELVEVRSRLSPVLPSWDGYDYENSFF